MQTIKSKKVGVISVSSRKGGKHDKGHVHVEYDIVVLNEKMRSPAERLSLFATILEAMLVQYSEHLSLGDKETNIVSLARVHFSGKLPEGGKVMGQLDVKRTILYPSDEAYESAIVTADFILLDGSREIMRADSLHFNIGVD